MKHTVIPLPNSLYETYAYIIKKSDEIYKYGNYNC